MVGQSRRSRLAMPLSSPTDVSTISLKLGAGRCLDNVGKRINQGYGRIHPKNCYLDGQSTNCRLNTLIAKHRDVVRFYVCILDDVSEIKLLESEILKSLSPEWNMQGV